MTTFLLIFIQEFLIFSAGDGIQDKHYVTAYAGVKLTWNEAKSLCEEKGSHLLKVDTESKHNDVFYWKDQLFAEFYWVGLHTMNGANCLGYQWHDCDPLGDFTNWETAYAEPNSCIVDKCIRVDKEGKWRTTSCNFKAAVLCEQDFPSCTFEKISSTDVRESNYPSDTNILSLHGNLQLCQNICQTSTLKNLKCHGILEDQINYSGVCKLIYMESASFLVDPTNLVNANSNLFVCPRIEFDVVILQDSDLNHIRPNMNEDPDVLCIDKTSTTDTTKFESRSTMNSETSTINGDKSVWNMESSTVSRTTYSREHQATSTTTSTTSVEAVHSSQPPSANLKSRLALLVKETKINKKSTTASLHKRISVMETRVSTTSMGLIASLILSFILAFIVISDIPIFIQHLKFFWCNK